MLPWCIEPRETDESGSDRCDLGDRDRLGCAGCYGAYRIEVVKGEAAIRLFGDQTTGGVIQIFLKDVGAAHPGG